MAAPSSSRIAAGRTRAAAANRVLAAAAVGLFGLVALVLHRGNATPATGASSASDAPASSSSDDSEGTILGGGSIGAPQSSFPQAQTGTS